MKRFFANLWDKHYLFILIGTLVIMAILYSLRFGEGFTFIP